MAKVFQVSYIILLCS